MKRNFKCFIAILAVLTLLCPALLTACQETETEAVTTATQTETTADPSGQTTAPEPEEEENPAETFFEITFATDENVTVTVYPTQNLTGTDGETTTVAKSRDGDTGALLGDGNGQVNFVLTFAEGYELGSITVTPTEGYNKVKGSADTGAENGYRITKITRNLTVTVVSQASGTEEDLTQGYQVTFLTDANATVTVYPTQNLTGTDGKETTVGYSRESGTGKLTKTDGQVNFVVTVADGFEIESVAVTSGEYNKLKTPADESVANSYRITKIASDLEVTVTTKAITG